MYQIAKHIRQRYRIIHLFCILFVGALSEHRWKNHSGLGQLLSGFRQSTRVTPCFLLNKLKWIVAFIITVHSPSEVRALVWHSDITIVIEKSDAWDFFIIWQCMCPPSGPSSVAVVVMTDIHLTDTNTANKSLQNMSTTFLPVLSFIVVPPRRNQAALNHKYPAVVFSLHIGSDLAVLELKRALDNAEKILC